jgi:hypothetical protein
MIISEGILSQSVNLIRQSLGVSLFYEGIQGHGLDNGLHSHDDRVYRQYG